MVFLLGGEGITGPQLSDFFFVWFLDVGWGGGLRVATWLGEESLLLRLLLVKVPPVFLDLFSHPARHVGVLGESLCRLVVGFTLSELLCAAVLDGHYVCDRDACPDPLRGHFLHRRVESPALVEI